MRRKTASYVFVETLLQDNPPTSVCPKCGKPKKFEQVICPPCFRKSDFYKPKPRRVK